MQERAIRTRQHVLESAAVIFDRDGYEAANIAEILKEAGVTKGALYFHFPSKTALARAIMDMQTSLVSVNQSGPKVQSVVDLTFDVAALLQTDPLMRAGIRLTVEQGTWKESNRGPYLAWIELITGIFEEAKTIGELRDGANPREFAELVVAAFTGTQLLSEVLNRRQDLLERIERFWSAILPSFVSRAIEQRLDLLHARARLGRP